MHVQPRWTCWNVPFLCNQRYFRFHSCYKININAILNQASLITSIISWAACNWDENTQANEGSCYISGGLRRRFTVIVIVQLHKQHKASVTFYNCIFRHSVVHIHTGWTLKVGSGCSCRAVLHVLCLICAKSWAPILRVRPFPVEFWVISLTCLRLWASMSVSKLWFWFSGLIMRQQTKAGDRFY